MFRLTACAATSSVSVTAPGFKAQVDAALFVNREGERISLTVLQSRQPARKLYMSQVATKAR